MDRAQLVDMLWDVSPLFLTRDQFAKTLEGWEIHEVEGPNGLGAIVVAKGPEFHFSTFPGFQVTREVLRRWPGELIAKYGYAETRTPKDDERQLRFNRRLGFEVIAEDEYDFHMRLTHFRVKEKACPSSL